MPAYLHWIVYVPFVVFCAAAAAAAVTNWVVESRARRPAPALQPTAKIIYFMPAKSPLRSGTGAIRPELRLVSNGG